MAGLLGGLLGVGGGFALVPLQVIFAKVDQHHANGTSLAAIIPSALVGALKAALRRSPSLMMHLASRVEVKGMTFDGEGRTLQFNGEQVSFTVQEWDLLAVFLSHPNRFLSAREIIRLGWRAGDHEAEQVRIYVRRLRLKLEPLNVAFRLVSQHNRGYSLIVD